MTFKNAGIYLSFFMGGVLTATSAFVGDAQAIPQSGFKKMEVSCRDQNTGEDYEPYQAEALAILSGEPASIGIQNPVGTLLGQIEVQSNEICFVNLVR